MSNPRLPALLLLALAAAAPAGRAGAADARADSADAIVPLAVSIKPLRNLSLDVEGQKVTVSLEYARQGSTVFPMPVWIVLGTPELLLGPDNARRRCSADRPLLKADDPTPSRLRVELSNLLGRQKTRKAVYVRLREELADLEGKKAETIRLEPPLSDRNGYRITLCAAGSGRPQSPAEVSLSQTAVLPPVVADDGGEVYLDLLPEMVAALKAEKGRDVLLKDTYLRVEGSLKAQFETVKYKANFTAVRQAVTGLQNHIKSVAPSPGESAGESPEAIVHVPVGGEVGQESSATSALTQSLVVSVYTRAGEGRDLAAMRELTDRVLQSVLQDLSIKSMDDRKRVAFLMGQQVTVSATVGEIRKLTKKTRAEREASLKAAVDDWEARRNKQDNQYTGNLSVGVELPLDVPITLGAKGGGDVKRRFEEEQARQKKETMETVQKGIDELKQHFEGKVPTLSGIQFDQKALSTTLDQVGAEVTKGEFTVGWSHHLWEPVRLGGASESLDPGVLAGQLAEVRHRLETVKGLLDKMDHLEKIEASYLKIMDAERQVVTTRDKVNETQGKVELRLKDFQAKLDAHLAELRDDPPPRTVEAAVLRAHTKPVLSVAASADGKLLASAAQDGSVKVWEAATGHELRTLSGHTAWVGAVAFNADGTRLVTASGDKTVKVWDVETGKVLATLTGHTDFVYNACFSPDGKRLASASKDRTVKVWDVATGFALLTLAHDDRVTRVAFSPDGKRLVSGSDVAIKVWDAATGTVVRTIANAHEKEVRSVCFSPDGKRLASASEDGTVKLWDAETGAALLTLRGHGKWVECACFSPDGKRVASASFDRTIKVWDAQTGALLRTVSGHKGDVWSVVFSRSGRRLASASSDRTVRVWDLEAPLWR